MRHGSDHTGLATRPALEIKDIPRECCDAYGETYRLSAQQQRVVDALVNCRTAALGGFKARFDHCRAMTIQYASCPKRHCPKVEALVKVARRKFLVPILEVPDLAALNERLLPRCLERLDPLERTVLALRDPAPVHLLTNRRRSPFLS